MAKVIEAHTVVYPVTGEVVVRNDGFGPNDVTPVLNWCDGEYFNVDHRAGPEEFVDGLNAVLEAQKSPLRFVLLSCGDDNYYFGIKK